MKTNVWPGPFDLRAILGAGVFALIVLLSFESRASGIPDLSVVGNDRDTIDLYCAKDCNTITIRLRAYQKPEEQIGPISVQRFVGAVKSINFKREFLWSSGGPWNEIKYDSSAGGLNIILPVLWVVLGTVGAFVDLDEVLYSRNDRVQDSVTWISRALISRRGQQIDIGFKAMDSLSRTIKSTMAQAQSAP